MNTYNLPLIFCYLMGAFATLLALALGTGLLHESARIRKERASGRSSNGRRPRYDLAVCYRISPNPNPKPNILGRVTKLCIVQAGLRSFREAIGELDAHITVILDGCPEWQKMVEEELRGLECSFVHTDHIGITGTLLKQIEILSHADADFVYFAEDDYLFHPKALEDAHRFLRSHQVDALSLAYHPDYNRRWVDNIKEEGICFEGRTWKKQVANTSSFMIRRSSLLEAAAVIGTFSSKFIGGNSDLGFWMALTKLRVANPLTLILGWKDGRFIPGSVVLSWLHCWRQILFGRTFTLYAPMRTLATHMEADCRAVGW